MLSKAKNEFELEILLPKKSTKKNQENKQDNGIANFYFNEFKICVGKNEKGNENLLKSAKKEWFVAACKRYSKFSCFNYFKQAKNQRRSDRI